MYNNYWNPNQDRMVQKGVPNVETNYSYYPNTSAIQAPNFQNSDDGRQTQRRISLTAIKGNGMDLGDGFESFSWDAGQINSNEYLLAFLDAPGMKVINGGWAPGDNAPLYALENYPRKKDQWVITLFNQQPGNPRPIRFYLIAKS